MLSYLLFVATISGVYALLGLGLLVIWGQSGMVNLDLAGFFALGAYATALLTTVLSVPIVLGWLAAVVLTALGVDTRDCDRRHAHCADAPASAGDLARAHSSDESTERLTP